MRKMLLGLGALAGGSAAALAYAHFVEPYQVEVTHTSIPMSHLDAEFHHYRIVQISDIHLDSWMSSSHLMSVVQLVNAQQADLIVITGDFITSHTRYILDELRAALHELHAPDGVMAIPGNHDHKKTPEIIKIREMLHDCGIVDLSNTALTLRRGTGVLHIAGVDSLLARRARLDLTLAAIPPEGAVILLAHEPDFADVAAATHRFDLQLSGHTHGGQVRIPGYGAVGALLPRYGRLYVTGLVKLDNLYVYVNRGIGMVTVPLRFNCRPEVAVLTLKAPHDN